MNAPRWLFAAAFTAATVVALAQPGGGTPPAATAAPSLQQLLDRGTDLPFNPDLAAVSCPVERAAVKEGSDADRYKVSTTLTAVSIAYLRGRAKPSTYPKNNRLAPVELHTYGLKNVYVTQYKTESDGDIHLVLKDSSNRSMIAELPYGACVPSASRWKSSIATACSTFTQHLPTTTSWHYTHRLVDLRGLALFDPPHGQTGAAPNGIEIHPVTNIYFH